MTNKIYKHSKWKLFSPLSIPMWLLFSIMWLIARLNHKTILKIGNFLGAIIYKLFPKRTYIVKTNLELCFPDKTEQEINTLIKEHFQSLIAGTLETAIAWFGSNNNMRKISRIIKVENEHIIKEYINKPEPLLLVTPHAVSQELLSRFFTSKYDYVPVFRHMNNPVANYLMQRARLKIYKQVLLKADIRSIVNKLKANNLPVTILPDQDFGRKRSVFVPFFGIPAATTTALSKYKRLTNCTILPLSYYREYNKTTGKLEKYVIKVDEPLNITGKDYEHDAKVYNESLEQIIRKDISAYFWVAKKFKTRPAGEAKIYKYPKKSKYFSHILKSYIKTLSWKK